MSAAKRSSVERNYIRRLDEVAGLPAEFEANWFLNERFRDGGATWRIFWLHCCRPERFPIYDQHVHRAMTYIRDGAPAEPSEDDEAKVRLYAHEYMPFHRQFDAFAAGGARAVDKALWTFGQFIKDRRLQAAPARYNEEMPGDLRRFTDNIPTSIVTPAMERDRLRALALKKQDPLYHAGADAAMRGAERDMRNLAVWLDGYDDFMQQHKS